MPRTWFWLQIVLLDIRFGVRQFRNKPILLAVAALSLALGIGANAAIFTVINAVLLSSLPVRNPAQLVLFYDGTATGTTSGDMPTADEFSFPFWQSISGKIGAFEDLCAFRQSIDRTALHIAGSKSTAKEQASAHLVSGNYFRVLGITAAAGRVLQTEDDVPNATPVAVISYRYWRDRFARSAAAIGSTAVLNGTAFAIVGVAAPEFFGERVGPGAPDFFVPLAFQPQILLEDPWRGSHDMKWLNMLGRLHPGATRSQAEAEVNLRFHEYLKAHPSGESSPDKSRRLAALHIHLKPGGAGISGLRFRYSEPLHILLGAVTLVLFIACANVAILFLSRASARSQEFLARLALGASRARVIQQVLVETVLLSCLAGLVGAGLAWAGVRALLSLFGIASMVQVGPDPLVLGFTAATSILTGIVFGVVPAIRCSRLEPRPGALVRPVEFGTGRFGSVRVLISAQLALSLVLLFGAAILTHSLSSLEKEHLGFTRQHILLVRTDPRIAGYRPSELPVLYQQLETRLNAIPGVISASLARYSPLDGTTSTDNFTIKGRPAKAGERPMMVDLEVGPKFFETLRIPILNGRGIEERDLPSSPPVAIINQTFQQQFFPHVNPIGQHFSSGSPFAAPGFEIVGVAGDARFLDVRERARPMAFFSASQGKMVTPYVGTLILATAGTPTALVPQVRRLLQSIDSRLPIVSISTLDEQIEHSLAPQMRVTELCSVFSLLALALAAVGIYGSTAYLVARRTPEMGIRMALGAERSDVLWLVLKENLVVMLTGVLVGLPAALAATRLIRGLLYGVEPADPIAIAAAGLLIVAAGLTAAFLPALRATKIDPMLALRYE
jgi:macrolide transport system ATP-binding/permease protein